MSKNLPVIFLIDDEEIQLGLMKTILSTLPLEIKAYSNPEKAWEELSVHHPQVVLLDLNMPKLNGQGWMTRLSEERKMNDFSLVVVTANRMDEDTEFGLLSMGAMEVVSKPVKPEEIRQLVMELLSEKL